MLISKIMILVEDDRGVARQVLTSAERKRAALQMLLNDAGELGVSEPLEPVMLKFSPVREEEPNLNS